MRFKRLAFFFARARNLFVRCYAAKNTGETKLQPEFCFSFKVRPVKKKKKSNCVP